MFAHYFAHYLLNKNILTPRQMQDVLEYERSVRVKLGVIAMNAGLMSAGQVEEIHALQRSQDKPFGAIAVERGYLTDEQLDRLLAAQGNEQSTLVQAIADKGYLSLAAMERIQADYRREDNEEEEDQTSQGTFDWERIIKSAADFSGAGAEAGCFCRYTGLLLRNIVRFLNETPVILASASAEAGGNDWLVSQKIVGSVKMETGLIMKEAVLLAVANRFSGENLTEVNDLALDSAAEFLNLNNGVFSGSLSQDGTEVDLMPQQIEKGNACADRTVCRVPIGLSFGRIDLLLSRSGE
ncbi:MAG: hypothetical protein P4N41_10305 [Negativicutes bacterium]|nr:hypothetical protein [Negativicutes bacterium]